MIKLKNNVEKLNNLIKAGKIAEAFEQYYGDEVVIQVNGNAAVTGKNQNRTREMIFLQEVEKMKSAEIKSVTYGGLTENISMTEWAMDIETATGENKIIHRVNVQHWKDNKVISERLYFCGDQKF